MVVFDARVGVGAGLVDEVIVVGAISGDDDVGVLAFGAVGGEGAGFGEEVFGLRGPGFAVGGAVDAEALPDVGDQPAVAVPLEDLGAFAGARPS